MTRAYCCRCNRLRKKGEWKTVELKDERFVIKQSSRGPKKILYGKCSDCGCTVTSIVGC